MTDDAHDHVNTTTRHKTRRIITPGIFLKAKRQQQQSADEIIIRRLQQENRQLRQELNDANYRIHELEAAAAAAIEQRQHRDLSLTSSSSATAVVRIRDIDYRDDHGDNNDDADYDSDNFSIEVESATVESSSQQHLLDNELLSVTSSSDRTIPTGNDKKSKHRRHLHLRRRWSSSSSSRRNNDDARRNYFTQRRPMQSITEINTSTTQSSLLDGLSDYDDLVSTTSDLSSSVTSSTLSTTAIDDNSTSLMAGRMLPLYAMKSLLRVSSTDSDMISTADNESVLYGEI